MPAEAKEFRIEIPGACLHGCRFSPGVTPDAPAVLLIHGARGRAEDLADLARQFTAEGLETITYSMAGYGGSDRITPGDSDRRHAADLCALLPALTDMTSSTGIVLLGTSRGAGIGLIAAALGAPVRGVAATGGALDWAGIRNTTRDPEIAAWLETWRDDEIVQNSAASYTDRVAVPVLLEIGEGEDPEVRRQNHELAQGLRDRGLSVTLLDVPGAGHQYLDSTFPGAWQDRLRWIRELGMPPAAARFDNP